MTNEKAGDSKEQQSRFDDIVADLLHDEDSERVARGIVEDKEVCISKTYYYNTHGEKRWIVSAELPDGVRGGTDEEFDDATEADGYFEMLLGRYEVVEIPAETDEAVMGP